MLYVGELFTISIPFREGHSPSRKEADTSSM